jgi:DNA modification methylase
VSALARSGGRRPRRPTATSAFGSSRRESHDASGFYRRFVAPEISTDDDVVRPRRLDVVYRRDARDMGNLEDNSIALVVTSPPYFAGKEYEACLGDNGVPGSYFEYLDLLRDVFAGCKRVLEPGGRIAVNVANLGRRPYRSLAGDVTDVLQELGLLMRGEVVWWKGRAAGGSCAWGTFQRPGNPVLRDVTERVVIASKGRFDRAVPAAERHRRGLPSVSTITRDEFLEATTDLWEIPAESATRVGHPAPFPVELPLRLIDLYTYEGDVVLDPFIGAGTTAVAALRSGRHFVGYDNDASYVTAARKRIKLESARRARRRPEGRARVTPGAAADDDDRFAQGLANGLTAKEMAVVLLELCGFTDVRADVKLPGLGVEAHLVGTDRKGKEWAFEVVGALSANRSGLKRADALYRALGRAAVVHEGRPELPFVLLTTDRPTKGSAGRRALDAVSGPGRLVRDTIELLDPADHERLSSHARGGASAP